MIKKVIIYFGIVLLMQSCKDEETIPDNLTSFPMIIGTEWIYEREEIINKYESETSDIIIDIETNKSMISVLISKDTVLRDSIAVKEFIANEIGSQIYSKRYYNLDSEGLKEIAYKSNISDVFAKKKSAELVTYSMANSIGLEPAIDYDNGLDILYFFDNPRLSIKLPLSINDKWTYSYPSDPMMIHIDKEVIGYESVKTSIGTFDCFKIKYEYINSTLDDIEWIDWISNKGLIRRQITLGRSLVTNAEEEILGFWQPIEIYTIKEIKTR